jgi:hypothetical protein
VPADPTPQRLRPTWRHAGCECGQSLAPAGTRIARPPPKSTAIWPEPVDSASRRRQEASAGCRTPKRARTRPVVNRRMSNTGPQKAQVRGGFRQALLDYCPPGPRSAGEVCPRLTRTARRGLCPQPRGEDWAVLPRASGWAAPSLSSEVSRSRRSLVSDRRLWSARGRVPRSAGRRRRFSRPAWLGRNPPAKAVSRSPAPADGPCHTHSTWRRSRAPRQHWGTDGAQWLKRAAGAEARQGNEVLTGSSAEVADETVGLGTRSSAVSSVQSVVTAVRLRPQAALCHRPGCAALRFCGWAVQRFSGRFCARWLARGRRQRPTAEYRTPNRRRPK